jgi:ATP-dependent helicase/nuclease subunit A
MTEFTPQQRAAIERRHGDLLLDASAGSGKTSVLVERFVCAVLDDGADPTAVLTITFTEKAAAELRDRIRRRLRELGADEAARRTEGAYISTIHGFCARVLRTHALAAGIDPEFAVLDETDTDALAEAAFEFALEELAQNAPGGVELIAAHRTGLREAILGTYAELRARGELRPSLPPVPPAPDLEPLREELLDAASAAARELGAIASPAARVQTALARLERCDAVLADADPWPGDLDALFLPGGNGAALSTEVCTGYAEALGRYRDACRHRRAIGAHALFDRLLRTFGEEMERRKRAVSGVDFGDLELLARALLTREAGLRERYRARFAHVMVDELQDTNVVQLELIESVASGNLFTVGDAQQSIYGFRHADVELFERLGERLAADGARATLDVNFRSRPELIDALNAAFTTALGDRFRPLRAGRTDPPLGAPAVEMLLADKGAEYASSESLAAPWRLAEAAALAARVRELIGAGASPREIVVLTRATTDLRVYERALESVGIPTYVIGGRGYWAHPQVIDLVAYLRVLANPRDEEALLTVLVSPLVGLSLDGLVALMSVAHGAGRDPWWVIREPDGRLDGLAAADHERVARFAEWFGDERALAAGLGVPELIERALEQTDYDRTMLAMPGGARRLANVRKLMRLGREHETAAGPDLRGFLELVHARGAGLGGVGESRESEAPVEGEALDAVRLMTIHRAKGLEFPIVCVADLGRGPIYRGELIRVGRDGRLGLRLAEPGTARKEPALAYDALGEEARARDLEEERRLFYVAMTRACERLILSGAVKFESWPNNGVAGPIGWIGPAFVRDIAERVQGGAGGTSDGGVELTLVPPAEEQGGPTDDVALPPAGRVAQAPAPLPPSPDGLGTPADAGSAISRLSYSALGEYARCGYRFYAERVLGLPPVPVSAGSDGATDGLAGAERGNFVHAVLERLDFRRPVAAPVRSVLASGMRAPSDEEAAELDGLIAAFTESELCARLGRADEVRREERFAFLLGDVLMTGAFDVLARERGGRMLVVDYKTDRLRGDDPAARVAAAYGTQRVVYALAALRAGATEVEVAHVFLEAAGDPVIERFTAEHRATLERQLVGWAAGASAGRFPVTEAPERSTCAGCPAEGGLCSWPLEMTRRAAADRLF